MRLQVSVLAAACTIAALPFTDTFADNSFVLPVLVSAIVAAGIAYYSRALPLAFSLLISVVAYLVVGALLMQGAAWDVLSIATDSVQVWRPSLTLEAPLDSTPLHLVMPYAITWLGTLIAAQFALRTQSTVSPLTGPLAALASMALFSERPGGIEGPVGLALVALFFVFVASRSTSWGLLVGDRWMRVISAGGVLVVAALVTALIAPALSTAPDRFTLRDQVLAPIDFASWPSPLADFKAFEEADDPTAPLIRVSGDSIERIRLAVLDEYDGTIWNVSDDDDNFVRVGETVRSDLRFRSSTTTTNTFEIVDLEQNWLPSSGAPSSLELLGNAAEQGQDLDDLLRVDRSTGNVIIPTETTPGLSYELSTRSRNATFDEVRNAPDATALTSTQQLQLPALPPQLEEFANRLPADAGPVEIVDALQATLQEGFFSSEVAPGHSVARLANLAEAETVVGFDEQYASLMTVTLRAAGVPARVAVGFVLDEQREQQLSAGDTIEVSADDAEAWVEVPFEEFGWVAVDATPSTEIDVGSTAGGLGDADGSDAAGQDDPNAAGRDDLDNDDGASDAAISAVSPEDFGLAAPLPPSEVLPDSETSPQTSSSVSLLFILLSVFLVLTLLLLLAALGIRAIKARRRRRRQTAASAPARILGAYQEVIDCRVDDGVLLQPGETARQAMIDLRVPTVDASSERLLVLVEAAGFSPIEPDEDAVREAWACSDDLTAQLLDPKTATQRAAHSISIRSLRRGVRT